MIRQVFYSYPEIRGRANVAEPVDNRIHVPLYTVGDHNDRSEMALTVQQALELATLLLGQVQKMCRAGHISAALGYTGPGLLTDARFIVGDLSEADS